MCIEVRGGSADRDKADVDVQPVANSDHVTEQPPITIHQIGSWLRDEPNQRSVG
jgi:hypothetical protein